MSTHPNAVLLGVLTPDDLTRKTFRQIIKKYDADDNDININGSRYRVLIMESEYDNSWQIRAKEGDIAIFDMVTYGYGEIMKWSELEKQKNELESELKKMCEEFNCNYEIFITANYW